MGIRIHKVIGYGLSDLEFDKHRSLPTDRRLNHEQNSLLVRDRSTTTRDEYCRMLTQLKNNGEAKVTDIDLKLRGLEAQHTLNWINTKPGWNPRECFVYDTEYGLGNVMIIVLPYYCDAWARYDDIIDYEEETLCNQQQNRVVELRDGIYPFSSHWVDSRDRRHIEGRFLRIFRSLQESCDASEKGQEASLYFAREMGFKSVEEAHKYLAPMVPEEIIALCEWANIFAEKETAYTLNPLLYVYWS